MFSNKDTRPSQCNILHRLNDYVFQKITLLADQIILEENMSFVSFSLFTDLRKQ